MELNKLRVCEMEDRAGLSAPTQQWNSSGAQQEVELCGVGSTAEEA